MLKYLRITVTTLSLMACLLLTALWVRSYWWYDVGHCPLSRLLIDESLRKRGIQSIDGEQTFHASQLLIVNSLEGQLRVRAGGGDVVQPGWYPSRWDVKSIPCDDLSPHRRMPANWGYRFDVNGRRIRFPHWFLVALSATFAAVPWIGWSRRFSLRTLLIVTALFAVALGLIAL